VSHGASDKLRTYRAKRDFSATAEPAGERPATDGVGAPDSGTYSRAHSRFVVQRHRARRLHYDLRLEVDGVLVSWAVPKGPTLDAAARRLAVHVEDHPLDYFDFEGVIAEGEYGGGDVIVWDWGTWAPAGTESPAAAIEAGELHFDLHREKLAGRFALVRRSGGRSGKQQWLLVHKHDDDARPGWSAEDEPRSVKTGRTNEEVAAAPKARWRGDLPSDRASIPLDKAEGDGANGARQVPSWGPPTASELDALAGLGAKGQWEIHGRRVSLTNLDKVLFPARDGEEPVTKRDLIGYYAQVAPYLLPYLFDRAVNLHRYPNGAGQDGFWQKEVPDHAPDWLTRWYFAEASEGKTECFAVLDSVASLVWMANYAAVELHPWTSSTRDSRQPTWALIDIDPGTATTFEQIVELAGLYQVALEHLRIEGMPKVTGKHGIQIWVPVSDGYTFEDTRTWVQMLSRAVGRTLPELISWE
jgi:bifunctional non-homologous end joining protein LigD